MSARPTKASRKRTRTVSGVDDAEPTLLFTVDRAARKLMVGRDKVYQLIRRGMADPSDPEGLVSIKIGAYRRIPTAALEAYIERQVKRQTGAA